MQLSVESLRDAGGFTGAPVKRQIEWVKGEDTLVFDVYVRRLSYQTAVTDAQALAGHGDLAASRIAHSICDEHGKPVFSVHDITGVDADGNPVLVLDESGNPVQVVDDAGEPVVDANGEPIYQERGALDGDLTFSLLTVIGEVNGLGKIPAKRLKKTSVKKKRSGTS